MKKRKCRPSGRNCGQRWLPWPVTRRVTGTGVPPVAMTRINADTDYGGRSEDEDAVTAPRSAATARRVRQDLRAAVYPDRSVSVCRGQRIQVHGHPAPRTDSSRLQYPGAAALSVGLADGPRAGIGPRRSRQTPVVGRRPTARTRAGSLVGGVGISKRAGNGSGTTRRREPRGGDCQRGCKQEREHRDAPGEPQAA